VTDPDRPDDGGTRLRGRLLPASIALADAVLVLLTVGVWLTRQVPFHDLTDAYLLGDTAIGSGFALGGALVTTRVRRNAVGWLMLAAGTLYLVAAAVGSLLFLRLSAGDTGSGSRLMAVVFSNVWMPAVAVLIPLAIQLFPTGRPINRFWSAFLWVTVIGGGCATADWVLTPMPFGEGLDAAGPLVQAGLPDWAHRLLDVGAAVGGITVAGSLLAPLFRLVRRPGEQRVQVLWVVWATAVVLVANAPGAFVDAPPPVPLLAIPLIPLAMTVAVLRYRLFGITVVINRTVVYLTLTLTLLGGYLGIVYGLGRLVSSDDVRGVLATGVVAVAFSPLRAQLQRAVDRLMFGSASDGYGALAELGRRLQSPMTPEQVLPAIATTLADALRLPYVRVRAGRPGTPPVRTVEQGVPSGTTSEFALTHRGEQVGTLVVATADRPRGLGGSRRGLGGSRRGLLADLAGQAGPAVHSVVLTEELIASRQRTIAALEEERTRIRRDLHDGLGPALTGVVLKGEAARNLVLADPDRARELLGDVSEQTRSAVEEIRRLVYGLRPPSLDRHGLRTALAGYVDRLGQAAPAAGPALELDLPADLPRMDPAVEVAAYRIVTEALANVVRHSGAGSAQVRVWVDDGSLHLEVCDDGATDAGWVPGVGLTSMRERTEQLGGGFSAAGSAGGGRVSAWLPLAAA
jgi:signal transduction histidine kinase